MEQKSGKMLSGSLEPGFRISLHIKDLENVLATSHDVGAALPLTAAVREMMSALVVAGHADEDHSSLVTIYESLGNVSLSE